MERVAIVTGANKGIGYSIVKGLCEKFEGVVYLTSRDKERGETACAELKKKGLNPLYHQLDITDSESVITFFKYIRERHGRIDLLVNNAAILFLKDAKEPKVYQAERTISVNFFASVNFTESMLPLMRNGGKIINISSSSGHLSRIPSDVLKGKLSSIALTLEGLKQLMNEYVEAVKEEKDLEKGWGELPYVVSKNGVNAYTFMLNRRLANKGIVVNCVHPGYVKSDMTNGTGTITADEGAYAPLKLALEVEQGGLYLWYNGDIVSWDGDDPRKVYDAV